MERTIEEVLKKHWGYQSFRPLQEDIIESVLKDQDTLALLPTGGGKSLCFQVPALMRDGLCLVVTPLIALMRDQVDQLKKRGIKALAINSAMSSRELDIALDNAVYGDLKFLYLSPERLKTEMFLARLPNMKVNLLAVDEAHCISEWGFDFRPAYRDIAEIRALIPSVPALALTATATAEVVEDIAARLDMRSPAVFRKSFERRNLIYVVQEEHQKLNRILRAARHFDGSGIVYVNTRRDTVRYAEYLRSNGVSSLPYHGGMDHAERRQTQELWIGNAARVVVATNAFGMGIDKPDVRFVAHPGLPSSIEAYYQEAGRAGRDEQRAYGIMLTTDIDRTALRNMIAAHIPNEKTVRQVYRALTNFFQLALGSSMTEALPFDVSAFAKRYKLKKAQVLSSLKILEYFEYLTVTDAVYSPSRLKFLVSAKDLYSFEVGNRKFEPLIQLLLRSYEGLFDRPIRLNEYEVSNRLKVPVESVRDSLRYLAQLRMVKYREQTDLPFVAFPTDRLHPDSLVFDRAYLRKHAIRVESKMQSMINYTENEIVCRSKQLTAYFGDRTARECGLCDVCLSRKKESVSKSRISSARDHILDSLKHSGRSLRELRSDNSYQATETMATLRWMSEHEEIYLDSNNQVNLAENVKGREVD